MLLWPLFFLLNKKTTQVQLGWFFRDRRVSDYAAGLPMPWR
ncbi:MAG: hypothetical protein RLZZ502_511, partial [Pseudomonadota bacterium]